MSRRDTVYAMFVGAVIAFIVSVPAAGQTAPSPQRLDPYKNFKYRLIFEGRSVAGATKASSDKGDIVEYRSGSDPLTFHKSPGRNKFEEITLEGGVTLDSAFQQWASEVQQSAGAKPGDNVALAKFRRDISLEELNDTGAVAVEYTLSNCWPVDYRPRPAAKDSSVAIERLTIRCQKVAIESRGPDK